MEYLLKVSAVIVVFYGIYRLFLQRDTFFEANRWFLILGILMSFTIPLIVIPVYHEYIPREESVDSIESFQEVEMLTPTVVDKPFDLLDYLPMVYALGIIIFSLRFFFRLISLASVIKKNKSHKKEGYIFTETTTELSPFSFFKWIVYNPNQFNSTELEQIITHEKVHAKQYHSVDILLMEICCVLLWFHPFVWLYNKSLKQNLEFLADKYALNQFNDTKSYQYTLLKVSVPNHQVALSNHFYNSLIKKRIAMLQKSKSKKINLLKYALVVPALALFLMSFNTEDVYVERIEEHVLNKNEFIIYNTFSELDFKQFRQKLESQGFELDLKKVKRNDNNLITWIDFTILKDGKDGRYRINSGAPINAIHIKYENNLFHINSLDFVENERKKGRNDIFEIIIDKDITVDYLESVKKHFNDKYDVEFNFKVLKRNENNKISQLEYEFKNNGGGKTVTMDVKDKSVLRYNPVTKLLSTSKVNKTGAVTYGDLDVLAGSHSFATRITKNYSDKFLEKCVDRLKEKGIIIEFKNVKRNSNGQIKAIEIIAESKYSDKKKLIVESPEALKKDIMISYVGDGYGLKLYQEKAFSFEKKKIVVLKENINSKDSIIKMKSLGDLRSDNATEADYGNPPNNSSVIIKRKISLSDKNPLYIIDGKEISDEEFKKINPDDIDNITVLKDKHATEKYGEKGKNGVVEITMKKDNDSTTQVSKSYPDIKVVSYGDGVKTESLGIKQRTIELDAKDLNLIKNPLYIIDGEEVSDEEFKKINPDDIQSINVLKDKHATDKYGEKGKDGVIEITMKKKKK
ncbi:M56 family metallopeptidase [Wenyingzhuangia sp. chi5]|uniref:M56 family metallopeptidase n=1 Tax=Wenyingzhuangia gilva TaxID=3057677 RepID=A0ABT8VRD7_9FLAO|nr:M56 family metallopeptidase [Wenyingzhuangia sp. chi5]MDO3694536.1 M56 family metallopeptidase [Wenyingzhuangia sp. chi5]